MDGHRLADPSDADVAEAFGVTTELGPDRDFDVVVGAGPAGLSTGVFYGASTAEAKALSGEEVYVVGGENSAGQAAVHLARYAARWSCWSGTPPSPRPCPGT